MVEYVRKHNQSLDSKDALFIEVPLLVVKSVGDAEIDGVMTKDLNS